MLHQVITWIVQTVAHWGYPGIVALMFLESSFFPFPSEIVIAPAGYLAFRGDMSLWLVIVCGVCGSLLGAIFNYWLAIQFGRPFFEKYGRYLFVSRKALDRADGFFQRHGHISTFVGRLLPGIRQYISLPAGLARMNFSLFCVFTALGAGIWVVVLALTGFLFGQNQALLMSNIHRISIWLVLFCIGVVAVYVWRKKKKSFKPPHATKRGA
ncbi:MAG: DedA family protein [Deltaproteobacteria bacterium]|nr:MAG: DedA family protein [Deltaproteobacteria bacterium]